MAPILVGCCGWPEARAHYFQHFPVVELQDTFYQPPSREIARKYAATIKVDPQRFAALFRRPRGHLIQN